MDEHPTVAGDLEEFAEERAEAVLEENQEIARKLRAAKADATQLRRERDRLREQLDILERIREEAEILAPQPKWLKPPKKKGGPKRAILLSVLSDTHVGEIVDPDQLGDMNKFDLRIADRRLRRYFEKISMLSRSYLTGVEKEGVVLALGGDMISGEIHDELAQTNELSVFESVLWLAPRLVAGIEALAEEFKHVFVVSAPGNHPRDSWKPRYKGRAVHNADYLLGKMVESYFRRSNPSADSVVFSVPTSIDADFEIYRFRFSMEHGDEMQKTNPGTSEIGALGPVKRGTLRKARQRQAEGRPMDYLVVGHFHQLVAAPDQGFLMNGTLKGYDEFARGLHLKPEPPQQLLVVVTPEYGPTQSMPVRVSKRTEEGW